MPVLRALVGNDILCTVGDRSYKDTKPTKLISLGIMLRKNGDKESQQTLKFNSAFTQLLTLGSLVPG